MNRNEFKQDLEVDPEQLDVEAGMQGELFFKWAEKFADSRSDMEKSKLHLDVLEAKLCNKARMDPDYFGIVKVTEGAILQAVKNSDEYIEAYEEYIETRAVNLLLEKAVNAMEQRKRMIEILVTLHGQQYFAGPSVPRNLVDAFEDRKKSRSQKVLEKTKIRTRKKKTLKRRNDVE